jgi:hypothetical protein
MRLLINTQIKEATCSTLIGLIIVGLVAGSIARALVPDSANS